MSKVFVLHCESCAAPLKSVNYPLACAFCGAENWANDSFSFAGQRAVSNLRLISSAQATYQATVGCGRYGSAAELFQCSLIPKELAEASGDETDKPLSGYCFRFQIISDTGKFSVSAIIDTKSYKQGKWNFYIDETGVLRFSQTSVPNENSEILDAELEQRNWR